KNIWKQGGILLLAASVAFAACRKKPDPNPEPVGQSSGTVELRFQHMVGESALVLDAQTYKNENGDDLTVSTFKYYISNIVLNGDGNDNYTEPESYHLVAHGDASSMTIELENVPAGKYKSVSYMIGVDSIRNVSGAQTGALDPKNGMFWSWTTGYIMAKVEGTSPESAEPNNALTYHIGGFSGVNNVLKTVTLAFPEAIVVNNNKPHMHIKADVAQWFKSPNLIDFA